MAVASSVPHTNLHPDPDRQPCQHPTTQFFTGQMTCIIITEYSLVYGGMVDKFSYLGDMLSVDRDSDAAVEARIQIGWNRFRQLVPLLTNEDISLIMRSRLYSSCVQSIILHGIETWPVRKENEMTLHQAEMRMIRQMCGIKVKIEFQVKS